MRRKLGFAAAAGLSLALAGTALAQTGGSTPSTGTNAVAARDLNQSTREDLWRSMRAAWTTDASGDVQRYWSRITDADLRTIDGQRQLLVTTIERRYDVPAAEAEKQVSEFERRHLTKYQREVAESSAKSGGGAMNAPTGGANTVDNTVDNARDLYWHQQGEAFRVGRSDFRREFDRLSDEDMNAVSQKGDRQVLKERLQRAHGWSEAETERRLADFERRSKAAAASGSTAGAATGASGATMNAPRGTGQTTGSIDSARDLYWHQQGETFRVEREPFRQQFDRMTDEDVSGVNGDRDLLKRRLQGRYGWSAADTEDRLTKYEQELRKSRR